MRLAFFLHFAFLLHSLQKEEEGTISKYYDSFSNRLNKMFTDMEQMMPSRGYQLERQKDKYFVEVEMAGIPQDKIKIQTKGGKLRIHGHHKECFDDGCKERRVDEIVDLPDDADPNKIDASLSLQILTIQIPATGKSNEVHIPIKEQ